MKSVVHSAGQICQDCLMLHANGEWPESLSRDELAQYAFRLGEHSKGQKLDMTLGHFHDTDYCHHEGQECDPDCDCERTDFSWSVCSMCGSKEGGYRHDVTFWEKA